MRKFRWLSVLLAIIFTVTLTACGSGKKITVVYDGNGGTDSGGKSSVTMTVREDEEYIYPTFTRDEYVFDGWEAVVVREDGSYYYKAKWVKTNKTTISFDSNGGQEFTPMVVTAGNPLPQLPKPTKGSEDEFTFLGWEFNGAVVKSGDVWMSEATEVTFVAKWQKNWTDFY